MLFSDAMSDKKPALSLSDIFLNSLREKYIIETYAPTPNSLIITIYIEVGSEPLTLHISDMNMFKHDLFFYINSLNHYYLYNSRRSLDKSFGEICRNLLVGLKKEDGLNFLNYIENITNKVNAISSIVEENSKKM